MAASIALVNTASRTWPSEGRFMPLALASSSTENTDSSEIWTRSKVFSSFKEKSVNLNWIHESVAENETAYAAYRQSHSLYELV